LEIIENKNSYIDAQNSDQLMNKNYPIQLKPKTINIWKKMSYNKKIQMLEEVFEDYTQIKTDIIKDKGKKSSTRRSCLLSLLTQFDQKSNIEDDNNAFIDKFDIDQIDRQSISNIE